MRVLTDHEQRQFKWTSNPSVKAIIKALTAHERVNGQSPGDIVRFVGGCVRDSLMGALPKDVDAATVLHPDETITALEAAGIAAHPTGLDHGTVTAALDGTVVEITTLRADVATDGRRATVAFTEDWALDAERRDFTINALYVTPGFELFDPVGGELDLAAAQVRFIGEADQRIKEDYLRILRFFRFSARFAKNGFDAEGLAACERLKDGIRQLSAERIGAEMSALLDLPTAMDAIGEMVRTGILHEVYPYPVDMSAGRSLKSRDANAPSVLMLAALWCEAGGSLADAWRLSNEVNARRMAAVTAAMAIKEGFDSSKVRAWAYRLGTLAFHDGLVIAEAKAGLNRETADRYREIIQQSPPPVFSLSGKDLLAQGLQSGPRVGALLKAIEDRWVAEDFPDDARLLEILAEVMGD